MSTDHANVIDGRDLAAAERAEIASRVESLGGRGVEVRLDAVLVNSGDSAARVYAEKQASGCERLGIKYRLHELAEGASEDEIAACVRRLNADSKATAVMVHMPLPDGVDEDRIKALIDAHKDVEGVNPANIGNVIYGRSSLVPCTALAAVKLIDATATELRGARVVVVGASATVGRPLAAVLMARDATVISCNKWTMGLKDLCRSADVLVSAAGVPDLIEPDMVKPGAVVIDVGITRVPDGEGGTRTVGDVSFEAVRRVAGWISPVPGGVGPMTVAMLLDNVVDAAERFGAGREAGGGAASVASPGRSA